MTVAVLSLNTVLGWFARSEHVFTIRSYGHVVFEEPCTREDLATTLQFFVSHLEATADQRRRAQVLLP